MVLAACASATPEPPPTPTQAPVVIVTATTPPTAAPSSTTVSSATTAPTAAASPTLAPVGTSAASGHIRQSTAASATPAASLTPLPPTAKPTAAEFTPQVVSVWDTELSPSTDNMQGTCSGPVNPVYGLVQVTPQGNTLVWKNQEPAPYTMSHVRANLWQYSGATSLGDGTVTMVVQFTSPTTLLLTRTFRRQRGAQLHSRSYLYRRLQME